MDAAILSYREVLRKDFDRATYQGHMLAALEAKSTPPQVEAELRSLLRDTPMPSRDRRINELLREIAP